MLHGDFLLNEFVGGVNFSLVKCWVGQNSFSFNTFFFLQKPNDNFNLMIRKCL